MIKHLPSDTLNLLLKYIMVLGNLVVPQSWISSVIVPLAKPGKDPKLPISYRPVALMSVFCKVFDRTVNFRLVYHLESNNFISDYQYGFRKNISTLDPLLKLSIYVQDSFIQGKYTISLIFDLEKTYDTTWKKGILLALFDLGFKGKSPVYIESFLLNRTLSQMWFGLLIIVESRGRCSSRKCRPLANHIFLMEFMKC